MRKLKRTAPVRPSTAFLFLPEAGDLLRREGPGLLDPEYLAAEARE